VRQFFILRLIHFIRKLKESYMNMFKSACKTSLIATFMMMAFNTAYADPLPEVLQLAQAQTQTQSSTSEPSSSGTDRSGQSATSGAAMRNQQSNQASQASQTGGAGQDGYSGHPGSSESSGHTDAPGSAAASGAGSSMSSGSADSAGSSGQGQAQGQTGKRQSGQAASGQGQTASPPPVYLLMPVDVAVADSTVRQGCWARIYDRENYMGDSLTLTGPIALADMSGPFGLNWDDRVNSIEVGPRATVTVYDNEGFRDQVARFQPDQRIADISRRMGFFDEFASITIACQQR
jgi:hypothetical protein